MRAEEGGWSVPGLAPYTEKHIFYDKIEDMRGCSPCTCGPPSDSACSALISVYSDSACSVPVVSDVVVSSGALCADVAPGASERHAEVGHAVLERRRLAAIFVVGVEH